MEWIISAENAPALGDIRRLGAGNTVWIRPDAPKRGDWGRYLDGLAMAIGNGADVRWIWES